MALGGNEKSPRFCEGKPLRGGTAETARGRPSRRRSGKSGGPQKLVVENKEKKDALTVYGGHAYCSGVSVLDEAGRYLGFLFSVRTDVSSVLRANDRKSF